MWKLVACDFWRDGGSYSATLLQGDRAVSLWLQVSRWERLDEREYEALFESDGHEPSLKQRLVPAGQAEARWLQVLEHEVDRTSAAPHELERFDELIAELRKRGANMADDAQQPIQLTSSLARLGTPHDDATMDISDVGHIGEPSEALAQLDELAVSEVPYRGRCYCTYTHSVACVR